MNIIITGASKGMGKAIATEFASDKQGHTFFLCARNIYELENTGKELQGRFPRTNIYTHACDVTSVKDLQTLTAKINSLVDKVDVLVNNAGIFIPGSVYNEEEDMLQKMLDTNLFGAYNLTRMLVPGMIKSRSGHIFNISSIAALKAYANGGSYSISKFAMAGFSKNLREEMKPYNIKVTTVYPGAVYTDSWKGTDVDPKRIMEAGDLAKMIYTAAHLSPQACVEEIVIRPQLGDL